MQKIAEDLKLVLKKAEVPRCSVHMWPEPKAAKLMPVVLKSAEVMKYLPEMAPGKNLPPRDFF